MAVFPELASVPPAPSNEKLTDADPIDTSTGEPSVCGYCAEYSRAALRIENDDPVSSTRSLLIGSHAPPLVS
jgi:hypothetical protein